MEARRRASQSQQHERARTAAAALIGADPDDVALISSVGYGVATAGKVLAIPRGSRVLVLEDDHTSPVLEWMSRAEAGGFTVEQVAQPADGDWTAAVLAAIERPARRRSALVSISSVHWSDGGALDLARDRARPLRTAGRGAAGRRDARRRRAADRREDARSRLPDLPDLQVGARPLWPRLHLCREAPPGRRAAGADRLRPHARRRPSEVPYFARPRPTPTAPGASTWASATISSRWRWPRSAWR